MSLADLFQQHMVVWIILAVWLIAAGHVTIILLFILRDLSNELKEIQRIRRELSAPEVAA